MKEVFKLMTDLKGDGLGFSANVKELCALNRGDDLGCWTRVGSGGGRWARLLG